MTFLVAALLLGAAGVMLALGGWVPAHDIRAIGPALVALVGLAGWFLVWLGRNRAAVRLMLYGSWVAVSVIAVFTGGVRSPVVVVYPVLVLMIGWLISASAALWVAALSGLMTVALVLLESSGRLPGSLSIPPAVYAVDQALVYVCSAVLIVILVRADQRRQIALRQASDALAARSADLEVSQAELQRAQAVARVGSWVYDIAADTMRLSDETTRIFGLPAGTTGSYQAYVSRAHHDDRDALVSAWKAALEGAALEHEHRITVGGAIRWVRQNAAFTFAPDGAVLSAIGTTQDITDRKAAEVALLDSEARYRTLVERTPQPILVHRSGKLLYVNAAAIKLFGAPDAPTLMRRMTSELIHPDFLEAQLARMKNILEHVAVAPMAESRFLTLDGTPIDVQVEGTSIVYGGEPAIQVAIHDITVQKSHQRKLERMAHYDTLTDLPNRVLLSDRLHQAMAQAQRRGQLLAVAYLDLDGFKFVNDHHGHETGDRLLVALSTRMKHALREGDTLARMGGDEFVAVLVDLADAAASVPLLNRLLEAAAQPAQIGGLTLEVSASLGVTFYPQAQHQDADHMLREADQAMYQAKLAGKNRYHIFGAG